MLEGSEDLKVEGVLKAGFSPYKMAESIKPDVILVDFMTLYNEFGEVGLKSGMKLILFDSGCGSDNIASAVNTKGLKGVLSGNTSPQLLKRAIRAVAEGGVWLDQAGFNDLPAVKMYRS